MVLWEDYRFTPYQVFSGDYVGLAKSKQSALNSMYERHPERFSNGRPKVQMPATEVLINPVPADADQVTIEKGVNFPTVFVKQVVRFLMQLIRHFSLTRYSPSMGLARPL